MARRLHPMEAGERDRAVTIQQRAKGAGSSGFPTETWTTLVTPYWCSRQDVGGRERQVANQLTAPYETRWEGPYREDMDPELLDVPATCRLVYQGRVHDIVAASMIGRREGIELLTMANNEASE